MDMKSMLNRNEILDEHFTRMNIPDLFILLPIVLQTLFKLL